MTVGGEVFPRRDFAAKGMLLLQQCEGDSVIVELNRAVLGRTFLMRTRKNPRMFCLISANAFPTTVLG